MDVLKVLARVYEDTIDQKFCTQHSNNVSEINIALMWPFVAAVRLVQYNVTKAHGRPSVAS